MTEKELDEMVGEANCNKDGHIDYEGKPYVTNITSVDGVVNIMRYDKQVTPSAVIK